MTRIIFVYNADSGVINAIKDLVHKNLSPETYPCSLCALTYDNLGMRRQWRNFVKTLGIPVEFLHRDELNKQYGIGDLPLPATMIQRNGKPSLWIDSEEMDGCKTLDELQTLISEKLTLEKG